MKRLPKGGIRKSAQEFVDADYLHKLSPEEKEWYDNFIRAEYSTNYKAAGKLKGAPLSKKEKKVINRKNYIRRHDVYNKVDRSVTAQKALEGPKKGLKG